MKQDAQSLPTHNDKLLRNLLSGECDGHGTVEIRTAQQWQEKSRALRQTIQACLGKPVSKPVVSTEMRIVEDHREPDYRRLKVVYSVDEDDDVSAWLLIPPPERRRKGAAVLCQHGTSPEAKDTQLGGGLKQGRDFARVLAQRGFITLAPDHFCAGDRQPDGVRPYDTQPFYSRHPQWSAIGKTIHDGQCALDVLTALDEVDPQRMGTVGHSLGGHGAFFLGAFDSRIKAAVSSCGLTSWQDNPRALNWARDDWYCYLPQLREAFRSGGQLPFDLYEMSALMAPRAFLNISGLADAMYGNNETLGDVGLQLHAVWTLLGNPEGFANFLFGAGHDVPTYSTELIAAWLNRWLANPDCTEH